MLLEVRLHLISYNYLFMGALCFTPIKEKPIKITNIKINESYLSSDSLPEMTYQLKASLTWELRLNYQHPWDYNFFQLTASPNWELPLLQKHSWKAQIERYFSTDSIPELRATYFSTVSIPELRATSQPSACPNWELLDLSTTTTLKWHLHFKWQYHFLKTGAGTHQKKAGLCDTALTIKII